jgi:hypothetical protein
MAKPIKQIEIKIFLPGGKRRRRLLMLAAADRHFTEDGIQNYLGRMAAKVEHELPGIEYRMIELGGGRYNFVPVEKAADGG